MRTAVLDVHDKMREVELEEDITVSQQCTRNVQVNMEDGTVRACWWGINIQHLLGFVSVESGNYYCQSFLQHLPDVLFKEFNLANV